MKLLWCFLLLIPILSCEKSKDSSDIDDDPVSLVGRFTGTFTRSGMDSSKVTLTLNDRGRFEGTSAKENYPAICHGSYTATENSITFGDSCTWTADFDWTLILNGSYNITYQDADNLRIFRSNGTVTDEYLLTRSR